MRNAILGFRFLTIRKARFAFESYVLFLNLIEYSDTRTVSGMFILRKFICRQSLSSFLNHRRKKPCGFNVVSTLLWCWKMRIRLQNMSHCIFIEWCATVSIIRKGISSCCRDCCTQAFSTAHPIRCHELIEHNFMSSCRDWSVVDLSQCERMKTPSDHCT